MYRAFLSFWRARFSSACTVPLRARQNALALGLAVALYPASCARADSIEQLRAFVAQVHAARGRFVQTLIEAPRAASPRVPRRRCLRAAQAGLFCSPGPAGLSGATSSPINKYCNPTAKHFISTTRI